MFRADSGCSPIHVACASCCNGTMSNANNGPLGDRGNAGPQPSAGQPYHRQPAYGSPQPCGGRFFAWIRSSQVKRGHDRWIGGVCDGIARRLGWNTTLVRALMVVATLFFGAGAAFYGLAWFVLPDERDNQILAEDLINGKWDCGRKSARGTAYNILCDIIIFLVGSCIQIFNISRIMVCAKCRCIGKYRQYRKYQMNTRLSW